MDTAAPDNMSLLTKNNSILSVNAKTPIKPVLSSSIVIHTTNYGGPMSVSANSTLKPQIASDIVSSDFMFTVSDSGSKKTFPTYTSDINWAFTFLDSSIVR